MKSKKVIFFVIITLIILFLIIILVIHQQKTGNPIIPTYSGLTCINDLDKYVTMEDSCESLTDCQDWATTNCYVLYRCNNNKMACKNDQCVTMTYFKLNRICE